MNLKATKMQMINVTFYSLSLFPLLFIISLLSFYFHVRYILGHFPIPSLDDPKHFSIYSFYSPIIQYALLLFIFSIPIWLIIGVMYLITHRKKIIFWKPVTVSFIIYVISIILFSSEILNWFMD